MPFAAALSTSPDPLDEVCSALAGQLPKPDLAVAFLSPHHAERAEALAAGLQQRLGPRALIGCVGEAIVGGDREVEEQPALSVWLGSWPRVAVETFHLQLERTSEGPSLLGWPDSLVGADPKHSAILLLGDPYTFPADFFLDQVNNDYQGLRVIGGMSSGGPGRGEARLLLDGEVKPQ